MEAKKAKNKLVKCPVEQKKLVLEVRSAIKAGPSVVIRRP